MSPTSYHTAPPRTKEEKLYAQMLVASRDINTHEYLHLNLLLYNTMSVFRTSITPIPMRF